MKKRIQKLNLLCLLVSLSIKAQDFTWLKGSQITNQVGSYGTQTFPGAGNQPGARRGGATWTDINGNLWLYGGWGLPSSGTQKGYLNDLWKYNISTDEWTWVRGTNQLNQYGVYGTQGVQSSSGEPGGRTNAVTWTDAAGNLWLFGGDGVSSSNLGYQNDVWKYNVSANQWTWMKGSNTSAASTVLGTLGFPSSLGTPGARMKSVGWVDASGKFWLYGGVEYNGSNQFQIAELWKYDPTTNEWTWVRDGNVNGSTPTYGTKGVAAPANFPGSLDGSSAWVDGGNLWLFGGHHYDWNNFIDEYSNAVWRYNISSNQWTWVSGNSFYNVNGAYGLLGVPSSTAVMGGRTGSLLWKDINGNPVFFGGLGMASSGAVAGYLGDQWTYSTTSDQWTWMKGSNSSNQVATYGTQGTAAPANIPGGRYFSCVWGDNQGNGWILGGQGLASTATPSLTNDLWKYKQACIIPSQPANTTPVANLTVCTGNSATLSASGTGTLNWYNVASGGASLLAGNTFTTTSLTADATYYVEDVTCAQSASRTAITVSVVTCVNVGLSRLTAADTQFSIYPNPNSGDLTIETRTEMDITITNALGETILKKHLADGKNKIDLSEQINGIYFLCLKQQSKPVKLVKIN